MKILKAEKYNEVSKAVRANGGYCPCLVFKNADSRCMCKDFREAADKLQKGQECVCNCGRFKAVGE